MPIGITNSLLSLSLILGLLDDEEKNAYDCRYKDGDEYMQLRFPDVGHVPMSGYCRWFLQYDKGTTYDVVHLLTTLDLNDINTYATHE